MSKNVSVIMSFFEEPWEILIQAITSTLEALDERSELILVCDSPDRTNTVKKLKLLTISDSRIVLEINQQNMGLVHSLNVGIKLAKGRYIARMDADDICLPNRFRDQQQYLEEMELDLIGSLAFDYLNEQSRSTIQKPTGKHFHDILALGFNPVIHPTFFVKKRVVQKLGGYRNIIGCEDKDFISRALLSGFRCSNLQTPTILYRRSEQQITSKRYPEVFAFGRLLEKAWLDCRGDINEYVALSTYNVSKKDYRTGVAIKQLRDKKYLKFLFSVPFSFWGIVGFIYRKLRYNKLCTKK